MANIAINTNPINIQRMGYSSARQMTTFTKIVMIIAAIANRTLSFIHRPKTNHEAKASIAKRINNRPRILDTVVVFDGADNSEPEALESFSIMLLQTEKRRL